MQTLRQDAAGGDRTATAGQAALIQSHLDQYQKSGSLSAADYTTISADVRAVESALPAPTTVSTTAPPTTSAPPTTEATTTTTTTSTTTAKHKHDHGGGEG